MYTVFNFIEINCIQMHAFQLDPQFKHISILNYTKRRSYKANYSFAYLLLKIKKHRLQVSATLIQKKKKKKSATDAIIKIQPGLSL